MSAIETTTIPQARASVDPSLRKPKKPKKNRPPADVIMGSLVHMNLMPFFVRMSLPEAAAIGMFFNDCHAGWGESGALSPIDYNRSMGGGGKGFLPPRIASSEQDRAARVLAFLRPHEVQIVHWIEKSRANPAGKTTLTLFGRENGNGTDDDWGAAQQGAGIMQMLARSILASGVYDPARYNLAHVPRCAA